MVFQKKGGSATKRTFAQVNEKIPKKKVFEAEEEDDDDDDVEDDSDLDDTDSDDASDSGDAISKMNAKGKQTPIQGKSPFLKTATKGQTQSPGLFSGKKNQLTGSPQKQMMQSKKELLGKKNQGKGKMIDREAVEDSDSEEDDDDDDDIDDDDDSGSDAGGKVNAKGKQTPQGKGSSLIKTPKGQAQTPVLSSGKKNQAVTPSPKQAKQNTMKEFPGMKGSAKKTFIKQEEEDDDDDDDEDDDDDDDEDDDSEDESAKTPSALNKSAVKKEPNGKKDMHVSFELPQKGGAAVNKKSQQNTPVQAKKNQQAATAASQQGKSAKQIGKVAPGKQTPKGKKKPASDDDDDLSDEEDEDMEEDDDDIDIDDDDDDEEEEDDDDDDEDDEEEEQEAIKKKIASLKKDVLPKKEKKAQNELSSKASEPKNKKGKTLLKNESVDSKEESKESNRTQNKAFQESMNIELQRKRERDARNLFVRGLPSDVTVDEIKALSPDILDVSLPKSKFQKKKGQKTLFGFLEFANEKKAEENYVKLQKKKIRGQELFIDYSGEKSKNSRVATAPLDTRNINKKKLHVSALPVDITMAEVAQLFPRSYTITLNNAPEYRNCSVSFHTEEDAAEAFKANENPKIRGRAITVLYAIEGAGSKQKKGFKRPFSGPQSFQGKQNFQPKKKMRM